MGFYALKRRKAKSYFINCSSATHPYSIFNFYPARRGGLHLQRYVGRIRKLEFLVD